MISYSVCDDDAAREALARVKNGATFTFVSKMEHKLPETRKKHCITTRYKSAKGHHAKCWSSFYNAVKTNPTTIAISSGTFSISSTTTAGNLLGYSADAYDVAATSHTSDKSANVSLTHA